MKVGLSTELWNYVSVGGKCIYFNIFFGALHLIIYLRQLPTSARMPLKTE